MEKSGSIFAANKVSEATQAFLRNNDQNLSIRSISIPCLPLKIGFTVVFASNQAGKVKKKLQDENVSLGMRHGVELIAKAAIGAVRSNSFLLLVRDGEKAFPNIKRSHLHRQINLQAPALSGFFETYYGSLQTSNFMEVSGTIRCLTQVEGVTIGNAAGSFGCCVALAPMYRMVHEHLTT